jgi:hypothetical protein
MICYNEIIPNKKGEEIGMIFVKCNGNWITEEGAINSCYNYTKDTCEGFETIDTEDYTGIYLMLLEKWILTEDKEAFSRRIRDKGYWEKFSTILDINGTPYNITD